MHTRPYTAILSDGTTTRVEDVSAPLDRVSARTTVEDRYPGQRLVALVPGCHASGTLTYDSPAQPATSARYVDPFEQAGFDLPSDSEGSPDNDPVDW